MKLRNFLIVLFAVLMVFAFASCKNEPADPKPQPKPQPQIPDYYQIEVTEGVDKDYWNRDKIKIEWEEEVNAGDTISLKYRSERDVYQWDIRDGSLKWVYESSKGSFTDPVKGEDGWWTLTYTFANDINGAAVDSNERFGVYFRGNYVSTDLFEIKDIYLNDEPLEITQDNIKSYAQLNEEPVEHDWTVKNWSVLFATGTVGEVDKTPLAEKVVDGGLVTGAPVNKEGYTLSIFTDAARTIPFDPTQPITEAKIFYYSYVGIPRTVIFNTMGGSAIENEIVANGDMLVAEAEPTLEGKAFKAWYKDEGLTEAWVMTDPVLGDMTLYAAYGDPATVTFQANNGEEAATKVVAIGNPVKMPETPTNGSKMFLGWFTDDGTFEVPYNFSDPVTADITIYAAWVNATDVTLMDGTTTIKTFKTALDAPLAADDANLAIEDDKIGVVFDKWYSDAACETAFDHTANVTGPVTLYANWVEAPVYRMVATHGVAEGLYDYDKFTIQFKGEGQPVANTGDVLSFRYRTTTPFTFFSIRGDKKWVYENSSATRGMTTYETKEDGWTYVTYEFAAKNTDGGTNGTNLWWRFDFGSRTIVIGDILEVQDFTLNGEPLTVAAGNLTQYVAPTLTVLVEADEWAAHTVTFNSNGGSEIPPVNVEYGAKVEAPAEPTKEGVAFAGWFTDEGLTEAFNFDTPIIDNVALFAKYGETATVTFSGAEIEPVVLLKGAKVARPDDPAKAENVFGGWFTDEGCTAAYDFAAAVDADITLYAKWIPSWTVTLNANYGETPATRSIYIGKGDVMTEPKGGFARLGYYFAGWYDEAGCTTPHDFSAAVTANTTLYAKYTAVTTGYKFTATGDAKDRWQFRWKAANVPALAELAAGDVFTFQVKFTAVEGSSVPATYRLRTNENSHVIKETSLGTAVDGWYTVEIVVPEGILSATDNQGIQLAFFRASGNIQPGDIIEIKNVTYNGVELAMTSSTSEGLYPGQAADKASFDL